jgi:PKD repeat protein
MNGHKRNLLISLPFLLSALLLFLACIKIVTSVNAQEPVHRVRLDGLKKNVGGLSSRYVVANTVLSTATTVHGFYDSSDQSVGNLIDSIGAGASKVYSLADITWLPDGYTGHVTITANMPITAALLPDPPTAIFTASPTSGLRPLVVTFTNQSIGDYTASLWSFGDKITSTLQSPTHAYTAAGVYTVSLTVSGPGGSDTLTRTNYITAYTLVQVNFTANPISGSTPLAVVFTNTSTGDYTTSLWDFGDEVTSTLESPSHIYSAAGVYTVSLTVSGPGGMDTLTHTNYITAYAPVSADFTGNPTSGVAPLTVDFTNTSTGDYTTSLWDFGDEVTSTLESPTHIYSATGTYTVTLTISGFGGSDAEVKKEYITVQYGVYLPLVVRDD